MKGKEKLVAALCIVSCFLFAVFCFAACERSTSVYTHPMLTYKTLQVDGDTVYGKVSNTTQTFSFLNEVTPHGGATYTVSTDLGGTQVIPTKTVSLEIGDNTFYVLATRDNDLKLFTVTIRRRPMCTVTYCVEDGTVCGRQQVEEDGLTTEPALHRTGYTLVRVDYDFSQPIVKDTKITVQMTANNYTVTLDPNGGTVSDDTQSVTYDGVYTLPTPTRTGYTFDGWYSGEDRIANSAIWQFTESKSLSAHWRVRTCWVEVTQNTDGGRIFGTGTYEYGTSVSVTAANDLGYTFVGWFDGETKLSEEKSYTITFLDKDIRLTAAWEVSYDIRNFTFTSTADTCIITGVKDKTVTQLQIPDYVTNIRKSALLGCNNLRSITLSFVGESRKTSSDLYQYPFGYIFGESTSSQCTGTRQCYYGSSTSYTTYTTYYIPSSLQSVTITCGNILWGAFYNCSGLMSITIPNGVTSIGSDAFYNCSGLTSIMIPDGVTDIGVRAFYGCSGLTSITIPDSVTSIGNGAVRGCRLLESITLPFVGESKDGTGRTHFGHIFGASNPSNNADYVSTSLKTVVITGGMSIGDDAFSGCGSLTNITIPNSVTSIGEQAFSGCGSLTSIVIPDSVESIGAKVLSGCSSLTNITIPFVGASRDGTKNAGFNYFFDKSIPSSLKTVIVTGGTSIGTFYGCSGLTSITIPDSVTSIGNTAFYDCSGLTSIEIPDRVTSIGNHAFDGCSGLTSITIPNSIESIGEYAFSNCRCLTRITIPDSVTSIGGNAFRGCRSLESITLPFVGASNGSWTSHFGYIFGAYSESDNADYVPSSLKTVIVTDSSSIGNDAFRGCNNLTSVIIPNSVTSIGNDAFRDCSGLTSVIIPDSVVSIGERAFSGCTGLTSVTMSKSVRSIGIAAFHSCGNLTSITLPNSLTSTGRNIFYNCSNLTIYCEAASMPSGWNMDWNSSNCPVVWGYKG